MIINNCLLQTNMYLDTNTMWLNTAGITSLCIWWTILIFEDFQTFQTESITYMYPDVLANIHAIIHVLRPHKKHFKLLEHVIQQTPCDKI